MGRGGTSQANRIGRAWLQEELALHIKYLELHVLTTWNAVQAFCQKRKNIAILLWLDNSTAVAYINHMGVVWSQTLAQIAIQMWKWALHQGIFLKVRHIADLENQATDKMSRITEQTGSSVQQSFPSWSAMATSSGRPLEARLPTHLPQFYFWKLELLAEATDAICDSVEHHDFDNHSWSLI